MNAVFKSPERYAVSAEEYLRMANAGVFAKEARLELIEGEIIEMAPIGFAHASATNILLRLLVRRVGDDAIVSVQNPLQVGPLSVPQPDISVLKPRADAYSRAHPEAADALLVIEVDDSSRDFDLTTKALMYARHGVIELWVVDVNERSIRVFREPAAAGYRTSFTVTDDQPIACQALPSVALAAREAFPAE